MITIFSAPKSFVDEHISTIQYNALRSWIGLGEEVEVLLVGDEPGLKEAASELDVQLLSVPTRSPSGAPLVSEIFQAARQASHHSILSYINADVILLDDFLPAVRLVREALSRFLVVGNRWDVEMREPIAMGSDWGQDLHRRVTRLGHRHSPMGSDFFIFGRDQFSDIPAFTLGRSGWDNWMMYRARSEDIPLVDASAAITAVHQEHDYAHLPGGEPHYRHPESLRNIELAGGYEAMFRLRDADWLLFDDGVRPKRLSEWDWPRKIEADLIAAFKTGTLAQITRMVFHPGDAFAYFRYKLLHSRETLNQSSRGRDHSA